MTRKHNYKKKIEELVKENKLPSTPGVYVLHIHHDPRCNFFQGGECNCDPELGIQHIDKKGRTNNEK